MTGRAIVLVAEDSATARAALRMHLVDQGYDVVEAQDGEQALEVARAEHPDVILLDVEMPVLDGHAVLTALCEDAELCDVPVVFLTGRTDTDSVVAGLHAGAHDYLRKPFDVSELVARVSAAARVKRLQDELRRRNEELDYYSRLDALTGLWNRRHLDEQLRVLCSAGSRHGFPVSVLLIDLDHFKSVNDTHGHAAGDAALRAVATCLREHMRNEDVLGRWGGEEFVAVVPYIDGAGAMALAERARGAVAALEVPFGDAGVVLRVTVSIGVCTQAGPDIDADRLVAAADAALYDAKAAGRNHVATR